MEGVNKIQGVDLLLVLAAVGSLVFYEYFLMKDSAGDVLVTAWVVTAFVQWVSVTKPSTPDILAETSPRKFLLLRAVKSCAVALFVFGDVYCSTSADKLAQWVAHNADAERSLRCAGGTIAWLGLALAARHTVINNRIMSKPQVAAAIVGGLLLSVGPALALRDDMQGRLLSAAVACFRVTWMLMLSSPLLNDTTPPKSAAPVMRIMFWAALIACFTMQNVLLVLSGSALALVAVITLKMQSPIVALCVVTAAGGVLSFDAMQIGCTIIPLLFITCSRFSCNRTGSFNQLGSQKEATTHSNAMHPTEHV